MNPSQQEAYHLFEALLPLVKDRNKKQGFRTRDGSVRRDVTVDEFMLMQLTNNALEVQFKHRDTRNYVVMRRASLLAPWYLVVPETTNPFFRGFFDKIELEVPSQ